jgi:hypothetical protein
MTTKQSPREAGQQMNGTQYNASPDVVQELDLLGITQAIRALGAEIGRHVARQGAMTERLDTVDAKLYDMRRGGAERGAL